MQREKEVNFTNIQIVRIIERGVKGKEDEMDNLRIGGLKAQKT